MDTLRISCAHDLAYVPQYAGLATGRFAAHSIDLSFYKSNGTVEDTVGAVNRGDVDVLLGSCVYGLRLAETGMNPVIVAQSNQQTRHMLAQRVDGTPALTWPELRGKSIVVYPGEAPTAWAAFVYALRQAGLTLADVKLIVGFTAEDAVAEFLRGVGDVFFVDGEAGLRDDLRVTLPVSCQAGRLPWSVYMADRAVVEGRREIVARFSAALDDSQKWLAAQTPETIASTVAPYFPQYTRERIITIVTCYRSIDLWATTSAVQCDQLERWSTALQQNGLLAYGTGLTDHLGVV
ncbi:ABC transporter substrate-binding protein [Ensifer canadensis]